MINAVFSMIHWVVRTNPYLQDTWRPLFLAPSKSNPGSQGRRTTLRGIWTLPLLGLLVVISSQNVGAQTATEADRSGNEPAQVPTAGALAVQVIAEGVGASSDEAIKDAFRNAVRQVVGAVVDAETLIKDDQVIDDKVLTYSDGLITKYEEVPGSKKSQGGLLRIKITAVVERKTVVAKLKAANVTVKELDGKGMFAEAVTKLESQADAKVLIAKTFADYPANVMKAVVRGKPSVETEAGKTNLVYEIELSVDLAKYETFQKKTVTLLGKVAQREGKCFVVAKDSKFAGGDRRPGTWVIPYFYQELSGGFGKVWWTGKLSNDNDIVVVMNTQYNSLHDRTAWEWFHVHQPGVSPGYSYDQVASPWNKRIEVTILFQDALGQDVVRDSIEIGSCNQRNSMPGLYVERSQGAYNIGGGGYAGVPIAYLSPYCFTATNQGYTRSKTILRSISTTPDELRRITAIKTVTSIQKSTIQ